MISKTKVLTLIVFGSIFLQLSAQDSFENDPVAKLPDDDRTFRFGLHFSPNLSWFKTNTTGYSSDGSKMGFSYGLSFEYFLSNNYLISSGITILNTQGSLAHKGVYTRLSRHYAADVKSSYKPKYIEIPLLLKLRTNEIGYFTYYGQFGINTAFNFSSSGEKEYTVPIYETPAIIELSNSSQYINWINLSLVVGAGVEYNISGNTSMFIGITFNNGFINQMDEKEVLTDDSGDALIGTSGTVYSEKDVNANLNYLALNLGIYF